VAFAGEAWACYPLREAALGAASNDAEAAALRGANSRESESGPEPTTPLLEAAAAATLGAASSHHDESESGPEPTAPLREAALGGSK
jgi:hypothetical protein